jgi:hypothetical protein
MSQINIFRLFQFFPYPVSFFCCSLTVCSVVIRHTTPVFPEPTDFLFVMTTGGEPVDESGQISVTQPRHHPRVAPNHGGSLPPNHVDGESGIAAATCSNSTTGGRGEGGRGWGGGRGEGGESWRSWRRSAALPGADAAGGARGHACRRLARASRLARLARLARPARLARRGRAGMGGQARERRETAGYRLCGASI